MAIFKNLVLALFVSITMLATISTAIAEEEITQESVLKALDNTISTSEEIVSALQSGADADIIEKLYRKVKKTIKAVVISDSKSAVPRAKGNKRMQQSRKAFRKGDIDKAVELASEGIVFYKKTKSNKI